MNVALSLQLNELGEWQEAAPIALPLSHQDPVAFRESVMRLQEHMLQHVTPVETPVQHYFADGLYAREMTIPKDTAVIGKIHKFEHISVVSKGEIMVFTEHGVKHIKAPCTMVSQPGTKRAVIAVEETVWTTFHPTQSRDLAEIEAQVIAPDYEELESFMRKVLK